MGSHPKFDGFNLIYIYGDVFLQKRQKLVSNRFWRDVVQSVYFVYNNATIKSLKHLLAMPIWYNTKIIEEKIQSWVDKGILTIGDLCDAEGQIFSIEYIQNVLKLKCDFLLYNKLKRKIQMAIGNNHISMHDNVRPRLPFILHIIETGSKGNKNTYFNSKNTGNNVLIDLQFKWSENLNDEIRLDTFANSFKNAKKYSPSVYQHFIQYKLLHRRIVHTRLLYKMGISTTPNCLYCNSTETIEHV